jgi:hypothetical protein
VSSEAQAVPICDASRIALRRSPHLPFSSRRRHMVVIGAASVRIASHAPFRNCMKTKRERKHRDRFGFVNFANLAILKIFVTN